MDGNALTERMKRTGGLVVQTRTGHWWNVRKRIGDTYGNALSDVQQRTGGKHGNELLERTETHWGTYGNAQSDVQERTGGKHGNELLERTETHWVTYGTGGRIVGCTGTHWRKARERAVGTYGNTLGHVRERTVGCTGTHWRKARGRAVGTYGNTLGARTGTHSQMYSNALADSTRTSCWNVRKRIGDTYGNVLSDRRTATNWR